VKKSVETTQDLFKVIIWIFLVVVGVFIFYKVFNIFLKFQENKKFVEIKSEIEDFLENNGHFIVSTDYLCFSSSFNEKKLNNMGINLEFDYENLRIVGENLKYLIKNGQAPVIIVDKDKVFHFYVKDLIFNRPVPVCFRKGEKIKVMEKFGGKTIVKED